MFNAGPVHHTVKSQVCSLLYFLYSFKNRDTGCPTADPNVIKKGKLADGISSKKVYQPGSK